MYDLDGLERRVCEKWIGVAAERMPDWAVPEIDFDRQSWTPPPDTPEPVMQFPREQWLTYPAKRTIALLLCDRLLGMDLDDGAWTQVCYLMRYGGKVRA